MFFNRIGVALAGGMRAENIGEDLQVIFKSYVRTLILGH